MVRITFAQCVVKAKEFTARVAHSEGLAILKVEMLIIKLIKLEDREREYNISLGEYNINLTVLPKKFPTFNT